MSQATKILIKSGIKKSVAEKLVELIEREEFLTANEYYLKKVPNQITQVYNLTKFLSIYKKYNKKNKLDPKTRTLYNSCVNYIHNNF